MTTEPHPAPPSIARAPQRLRLVSLTFAIAVALLVGNAIAILRINHHLSDINAVIGRTRDTLEHLADVEFNVTAAETAERGYALTGNANYLGAYQRSRASAMAAYEAFRAPTGAAAPRATDVALLSNALQAKFIEMNATISAVQGGDAEAARALSGAEAGSGAMEAVSTAVRSIAADARGRLSLARTDATDSIRQANTSLWFATLLVLVALAIFYGAIRRHIKKNRLAEQRLLEANETLEQRVVTRTAEISSLSQHLMTLREEEKKAMARELHDELGAHLSAINFDLATAREDWGRDNEFLDNKLARALGSVAETVEIKRRLIADLRPSVLDDLGLVFALEHYAEEFTDRHQIAVTFVSSGTFDLVSEDAPIALYRVVQESLTNVAKHSGADRVEMTLTSSADGIVLEIADNGIGIDALRDPTARSFGLSGMRERLIALGGTIEVTRRSTEGTLVRAWVPPSALVQVEASEDLNGMPVEMSFH